MANRAVLVCMEECCQRVMNNQVLFGGKVVLRLGDFCQTCPVVPRGTKADVLNASISQCPFWSEFQIARLIMPMQNTEDPTLASFVDQIGNSTGPHIDLSFFTCVADIKSVIDFVYGQDIFDNPIACLRRCILAPTNAQVDNYNAAVLNLLPSRFRQYHAADSLEEHSEVAEAMNPVSNNPPLPNPDAILDYVQH